MKRLLAIAILGLFCFSSIAMAQEKDKVTFDDLYSPSVKAITEGQGELSRFHGKLMFMGNNRYLSPQDVNNKFWKKYYGAQSMQSWGQYLWSLGLGYVATDLIYSSLHTSSGKFYDDPSLWVGGFCALVGGALDFGGWLRLGKLAKTYNSDPSVRKEYSLDFGSTRSGGIGLTLNF